MTEQSEFNTDIDEFFEILFDKAKADEVSLEQVNSVFPAEVRGLVSTQGEYHAL